MPRGVIKFYNENRGYGFIESNETSPSTDNIFLHYSQLDGDELTGIREGETVEYDVKQGKRGLEAVNVHKIS
jgi:CspA family cold shock protein